MSTCTLLALAGFSFFAQTLAGPQPLAACDCYITDTGDYFTNHEFFDFRNGRPASFDSLFRILDTGTYSGGGSVNNVMTPANVVHSMSPSLMQHCSNHHSKSSKIPNNSTPATTSTALTNNPTDPAGHLSLITKNTAGTQTSANLEFKQPVFHGSFRALFSVTGSPGGVAGFFTFGAGGSSEQDIEILTSEAHTQVHYTTHQPGPHPSLNVSLPANADWTNYVTHRLDWIVGLASFNANNGVTQHITQAVPTIPITFSINMWSAGEGWGGVMVPGGEARMNIQWIEAFYNTSGPTAQYAKRDGRGRQYTRRQAGACAHVCHVDGVAEVGVPQPGTGTAKAMASAVPRSTAV